MYSGLGTYLARLCGGTVGWGLAMVLFVLAASHWITPRLHPAELDGDSYLAGAEGLGTGQGYRMVSAIGAPPLSTYPPLHPALASWVWWLNPDYPSNLGLLHGWMQGLAAAALLLIHLEWVRRGMPGWLSALLCAAIGVSSLLQMLVVFFMAEPLFLLLVGAMAWWWREFPQFSGKPSEVWWWAGLGGLASLMYLTRSAAAGIVAGIFIAGWFGGGLKRLRNLCGFLVPLVLVIGLWSLHPKGASGGYMDYFSYRWAQLGGPGRAAGLAATQIWQYVTGLTLLTALADSVARFSILRQIEGAGLAGVARVLQYLASMAMMALIVRGFLRSSTRGDRAVLVVLFFYVLQIVVWPYDMGPRGSIVLMPWWIRWAWAGWTSLQAVVRRPWCQTWLPALAGLALLGTNLAISRMTFGPAMRQEALQVQEVGAWIRQNVTEHDIVGTDGSLGYHDLYRAGGRRLLVGAGGEAILQYQPVPQDSSLRARFLVVVGEPKRPLLTGWVTRTQAGNIRVLERPAASAP